MRFHGGLWHLSRKRESALLLCFLECSMRRFGKISGVLWLFLRGFWVGVLQQDSGHVGVRGRFFGLSANVRNGTAQQKEQEKMDKCRDEQERLGSKRPAGGVSFV